MPNIEENPDFQLLKQFLQSINPNDMDEDSAKELMDLGRMIQNGGALTDRQREMFGSVVGAMPPMGDADSSRLIEEDLPTGEAAGMVEVTSPTTIAPPGAIHEPLPIVGLVPK